MPIDDFSIIFGLAFFKQVCAFPIPHQNSLLIHDCSKTYKIPTKCVERSKAKALSAIRLAKGASESGHKHRHDKSLASHKDNQRPMQTVGRH
ncbi:conserved hypothetical protein [Ricinus communis]|uniref:Uncharacterized protein n=1 Tax=Ricinus communis TaxID=3988 RepID=B9ST88_RICCO|nr:conserved hypothetical protein [Ricinus communis]